MQGLPGVCVWGVVVPVVLLWLHAGVGEGMTTDASQTAILNRFNELRAAFSVAPVTWDNTAEGVAQAWADTCPAGHNSVPYGEVIAWNYLSDPTASALMAADQWYDEVDLWNCQHANCSGVCGHYLLLMSEKVTRIGCGNLNSGCSGATATIVCNMVLLSGFSFTTRPFPLTRCPNYPYFSDTPFRLAITINTTRKAYVKSELQSAVSTAAQLDDPNRVYVESTVDLSGGRKKVVIYIVPFRTSSGRGAAESLVSLVNSRDPSLNVAHLYATEAAFVTAGSGGGTDSGSNDAQGSSGGGADGGAIAAGVLVPLIVIGLLVAVIVAVVVWKKRGGELPDFLTARPSWTYWPSKPSPGLPNDRRSPVCDGVLSPGSRRDTLNDMYAPESGNTYRG